MRQLADIASLTGAGETGDVTPPLMFVGLAGLFLAQVARWLLEADLRFSAIGHKYD